MILRALAGLSQFKPTNANSNDLIVIHGMENVIKYLEWFYPYSSRITNLELLLNSRTLHFTSSEVWSL
jgi:hypothetical protein